MHIDSKFPTTDNIVKIISAKIPDENEKPQLYNIIKDMMIYGLCGAAIMKLSLEKMCLLSFTLNCLIRLQSLSRKHSTEAINKFILFFCLDMN